MARYLGWLPSPAAVSEIRKLRLRPTLATTFFDPAAYCATALAAQLAVLPVARRLSCDSLCHRIACTQSHP